MCKNKRLMEHNRHITTRSLTFKGTSNIDKWEYQVTRIYTTTGKIISKFTNIYLKFTPLAKPEINILFVVKGKRQTRLTDYCQVVSNSFINLGDSDQSSQPYKELQKL